jgi:FMN reductase
MYIVGFSGGLSSPSRTLALVNAIVNEFPADANTQKTLIDFTQLASQFGAALVREQLSSECLSVLSLVESADILVVGAPVYNAAYPGLFKHFFDLVARKGLQYKIVIVAANGASTHHALMIESHLRPLFSSLGAFVVPTGIYTEASDFSGYKLTKDSSIARLQDAVRESLLLRRNQEKFALLERA